MILNCIVLFYILNGNRRYCNTGYAYMASTLRKEKYKIKVLDFNHYHKDINKRIQEVKSADFVSVTFKSFTISFSISEWFLKKTSSIYMLE